MRTPFISPHNSEDEDSDTGGSTPRFLSRALSQETELLSGQSSAAVSRTTSMKAAIEAAKQIPIQELSVPNESDSSIEWMRDGAEERDADTESGATSEDQMSPDVRHRREPDPRGDEGDGADEGADQLDGMPEVEMKF